MKKILLSLLILVFIIGCYSEAPVMDVEDALDTVPPEQEEVVHVLEPEPSVEDVPDETVVEESKQIATGGTSVEEEEVTILSDLQCSYGEEGPEHLSFVLTNTESKKWVFNSLSYSSRETSDNPIFVLNALQVTNQQISEACGKKSLAAGDSVTCSFNMDSPVQIMVRKSIRTGVTPLGAENDNTLSVRTSGHAAEVRFLCE